MKFWKHFLFTAILVILCTSCSGGNSLNGRWEDEYGSILEISGKKMTQKISDGKVIIVTFTILPGDRIEFTNSDGSKHISSFSRSGDTLTLDEIYQFTRQRQPKREVSQRNINGTWTANVQGYVATLVITDSVWTIAIPALRHSESGTYSLSGNKGTFKSSRSVDFGTGTITNNTITLTLNRNTDIPGVYTFTKQ